MKELKLFKLNQYRVKRIVLISILLKKICAIRVLCKYYMFPSKKKFMFCRYTSNIMKHQ